MGLKWRNRSATHGGARGRRFLRPVPQVGIGMGRRAAGGGGAAPIAFLGQSINADGRSGAYASPPTFDPEGAPEYFTVTSDGFTTTGAATTYTRNLVVTQRIRQAYPNHASLTTNQVAISSVIYSTCTIAGGATNNSTVASPKPIANWARPDDHGIVGSTFPKRYAEIVAGHRNARDREEIVCIEWRWTDGVTTVTHKESTSVVSDFADDRHAVIVYRPSIDVDISSLSAGSITMNAKVYPWLGVAASVLDSADSAVAREFSPRTYQKTTTAPRVGYVRTTGNDGTGVVSTTDATASASPFLTVLGCINAHHTAGGMDNTIIYIGNDGGTPFVLGSTASTRTQTVGECIITRESGVARANARVSFGLAGFRTRFGAAGGWLRFKDVGVVRTGTSTIQGEAASPLVITFESVDFDNASNNAAIYANSDGIWLGTTITNSGATLISASTREHRMWRGVSITIGSTAIEGWLVLGCTFTTPGALSYGSRTETGSIVAFNRFTSPASGSSFINLGNSADVAQVFRAQNVIEYTSATAQTAARVSGDSATGDNAHAVFHHNTFVGFFIYGRGNMFYEEGATARTSTLMSCKGNIHTQINHKGDRVVLDGARVGNWTYLYGVDCQGEFSMFIDADSGGIGSAFAQAFPGLGANIGTSSTVRNDPLFTSYAGTTSGPVAGAGGGTYTLQSGSPCEDMVVPVLRFDLAGNARNGTATAAGAYRGFAEAA